MTEIGPKQPRLFDSGFLAFVRTKPCCICGARPTEAAHIRMGSLHYKKPPTGMQEKPSDFWAVPLCPGHHRLDFFAQHKMNEGSFWHMHSTDPLAIAIQLYRQYGGTGGKPKAPRKIKPRKPKELRQRIQSRGFKR